MSTAPERRTSEVAALALFGGAFNPPHRTHHRIAAAALSQLPIERVIVLPAGRHPWKERDEDMAPAAQRLELCRIAFGDLAGVELSDWEVRRQEPCYTVDTLRHFREYVTRGRRPFWLVGSDNLPGLPQWHRHHDLLELAVLATYPRAGHPIDAAALAGLDLTDEERAEILAHVLDVEPDDVSASEIRARLRRGDDVDDVLDRGVADRIRALGLYGAMPR